MCTSTEEKQLYQDAITRWGIDAQINMLIEEMGELLVAINKLRRRKDKNDEQPVMNLIEELADVQLMLDQIKYYYCRDGVTSVYYNMSRNYKMNRVQEKLNK
jgi:NTP pyrophosphatase (non-canonical NTP hydrolase)